MQNAVILNGLRDRSEFGHGEWDKEPDRIYWVDEETGLPCLILRSRLGFLCGYVAVGKDHPYFGKHYNDINLDEHPHGGLTYADACQEGAEETGICHIPADGEDKAWWFGFDCGHGGDLSPWRSERYGSSWYESYRNVRYVEMEVLSLARSLASAV